jgi:hypothetical protein
MIRLFYLMVIILISAKKLLYKLIKQSFILFTRKIKQPISSKWMID